MCWPRHGAAGRGRAALPTYPLPAPPANTPRQPAPLHPPPPPDDLRVVRELPVKAARDLAFSNGGAYLAAANGNTVHVWCALTAAPLAVLRGHNAKVGALDVWAAGLQAG